MIPPLLAIFSWPIVGLIALKRMPLQHAVLFILIAGYLFLPEKNGVNLPVLPTISKGTMPSFVAIVLVAIATKDYLSTHKSVQKTPHNLIQPGWIPKHRLIFWLLVVMFVAEMMTVLTNGDRLVYGRLVIQGLTIYDFGSRGLTTLMVLMPLLLGRKLFATPEQHKLLVYGMLFAGLVYSLPILWEARMSPQLNSYVYGQRVASWSQHVRNDGFRPVVFLHHGLWLAVFMAMSCVAAVAYIRLAEPRKRVTAMLLAGYLLMTLFLMNSLGGLLIALVLVLPVFFLTRRMQMLIAAGLVGAVLLFPMLRGAGLVPIDQALSVASSIDPARAQSLGYRFRHEDRLLQKAQKRPLFGWGSWSRNQVFDSEGRNISTTDGIWVIVIGSNGWAGYLSRFGLMCIPILLLTFYRRKYPPDTATAAVALMLTANMIDLIPNATLTPVTWLLAGALVGRLEYSPGMVEVSTSESPLAQPRQGPVYTRQKSFHQRQTKVPNTYG